MKKCELTSIGLISMRAHRIDQLKIKLIILFRNNIFINLIENQIEIVWDLS